MGCLQRDRYNIVLIQPPKFAHVGVFTDVARLLAASFHSLGRSCEVSLNTMQSGAINVLLGYQLAGDWADLRNHAYIIYQLEQLLPDDFRFQNRWIDVLSKAAAVWDYSALNVEFLHQRGFDGVKHLPLGYHAELETIQPEVEDIDVLFYGSANDRRRALLEELNRRCVFCHGFGVYGRQRDAAIARSKIVLNLHASSAARFEQTRVSYLLNNQRFVVSEPAADNPYGDFLVTATYDELIETCMRYLADPVARQRSAADAAERFRQMPMTKFLASVLSS